MINIPITQKMEDWARKKTDKAVKTKGFIPGIDKHESVYLGYVAEAAWWKHHPKADHVDARDYDFRLNGQTYDVKGYWTKYKPRDGYTACIPAANMDRGKGVYCIAAVLPEIKEAYLIGEIACKEFKKAATLRYKDQKKDGRSGFFQCDCFEIGFDSLNQYKGTPVDAPEKKDDCKDCPASALWPWYGVGRWCFHAAYFLGKATKPKLCRAARPQCPKVKK